MEILSYQPPIQQTRLTRAAGADCANCHPREQTNGFHVKERRAADDLGQALKRQPPGGSLYTSAPPKAEPTRVNGAELLDRQFGAGSSDRLSQLGRRPQNLDGQQATEILAMFKKLNSLPGGAQVPAEWQHPDFLVNLAMAAPREHSQAFVAALTRAGASNPGLAPALKPILEQFGRDLKSEHFAQMDLSPQEFKGVVGQLTAGQRERLLEAHKAAFLKTRNDVNISSQLSAFPESFGSGDVDNVIKQLKTCRPQESGASLDLLLNLSQTHPQAELREKALGGLLDKIPAQNRARVLEQLGPKVTLGAQKLGAKEGGELGRSLAPAMPEGPLKNSDLTGFQSALQKKFGELLGHTDHEGELKKSLQEISDPKVRERLLGDFDETKRDLTLLRRLLGARGLADNNYWQYQNNKTIDAAACDRKIAALMGTPRVKELMSSLQREVLEKELPGAADKAKEHLEYLKGEDFRDRLKLLATPGGNGLNEEQRKLLVDNVSRVSAFETDPDKQNKIMAEVAESLTADPKLGFQPDPAAGEKFRQALDELQKDPSLSSQEKSVVAEIAKYGVEAKNFGKGSYEIYKSLTEGEKALTSLAARSAAPLAFGKTLNCLKMGMHYMGPSGEIFAAVENYEGMRSAIQEGDANAASLKFGALAAGSASAGLGIMALCMASGPPGWLIGGLAVTATALGLAGDYFSEDPFIKTGLDYGVLKEGRPAVIPGPGQGWDSRGRICRYTEADPTKRAGR